MTGLQRTPEHGSGCRPRTCRPDTPARMSGMSPLQNRTAGSVEARPWHGVGISVGVGGATTWRAEPTWKLSVQGGPNTASPFDGSTNTHGPPITSFPPCAGSCGQTPCSRICSLSEGGEIFFLKFTIVSFFSQFLRKFAKIGCQTVGLEFRRPSARTAEIPWG